MKIVAYVFAALTFTALFSLNADMVNVAICKNIQNDSERLVCYDSLFESTESGETKQTLSETTSTLPADSNSIVLPLKPTVENPSKVEQFGAEQVKPVTPHHIEARIVGEFNGWSGKTVFKLDNEQIWKQINNGVRDYKTRNPMTSPKVTISKGLFGSYNFRVEGVKRMIQVKRVK